MPIYYAVAQTRNPICTAELGWTIVWLALAYQLQVNEPVFIQYLEVGQKLFGNGDRLFDLSAGPHMERLNGILIELGQCCVCLGHF